MTCSVIPNGDGLIDSASCFRLIRSSEPGPGIRQIYGVSVPETGRTCWSCRISDNGYCGSPIPEPQNAWHQLHRFIVGASLIPGIKLPQLFQIFKFIDLIVRLAVDIHVQLCRMLHQHMLPVKLFRPRGVVALTNIGRNSSENSLEKIHRPVHDPAVTAADLHVGDPSLLIIRKNPF